MGDIQAIPIEQALPYIIGFIITIGGMYIKYRQDNLRRDSERQDMILMLQKQINEKGEEITKGKTECLEAISAEREARQEAEGKVTQLQLQVDQMTKDIERGNKENSRLTVENQSLGRENVVINEMVISNQNQIKTTLTNLELVINRGLDGVNKLMERIDKAGGLIDVRLEDSEQIPESLGDQS